MENQSRPWKIKLFFNLRYGSKAFYIKKNGWSYPTALRLQHICNCKSKSILLKLVYICVIRLDGEIFFYQDINFTSPRLDNSRIKIVTRAESSTSVGLPTAKNLYNRRAHTRTHRSSSLSHWWYLVWELATCRGEFFSYATITIDNLMKIRSMLRTEKFTGWLKKTHTHTHKYSSEAFRVERQQCEASRLILR